VFVNGQPLGRRRDAAAATLTQRLPAGAGARRLSVVFEVRAGEPYGFGDVVRVRPLPKDGLALQSPKT
jgi:hypothetical protein